MASNGRVFLPLKWSVCATKKDISLHNIQRNIWKIQDGGCWHVRFIAFVTILLNRPYRSRQFINFKASFSCQKHQGKIYNTQRILVANLATNFWILVTSTIILVALATVLGAISCPVLVFLLKKDSEMWKLVMMSYKFPVLYRLHFISNSITTVSKLLHLNYFDILL